MFQSFLSITQKYAKGNKSLHQINFYFPNFIERSLHSKTATFTKPKMFRIRTDKSFIFGTNLYKKRITTNYMQLIHSRSNSTNALIPIKIRKKLSRNQLYIVYLIAFSIVAILIWSYFPTSFLKFIGWSFGLVVGIGIFLLTFTFGNLLIIQYLALLKSRAIISKNRVLIESNIGRFKTPNFYNIMIEIFKSKTQTGKSETLMKAILKLEGKTGNALVRIIADKSKIFVVNIRSLNIEYQNLKDYKTDTLTIIEEKKEPVKIVECESFHEVKFDSKKKE